MSKKRNKRQKRPLEPNARLDTEKHGGARPRRKSRTKGHRS